MTYNDDVWGTEEPEVKLPPHKEPRDIEDIDKKVQQQMDELREYARQQEQRALNAEKQARELYLHNQSMTQGAFEMLTDNLEEKRKIAAERAEKATEIIKAAAEEGDSETLAKAIDVKVKNLLVEKSLEQEKERFKASQTPNEVIDDRQEPSREDQIMDQIEQFYPWLNPNSPHYREDYARVADAYIQNVDDEKFYSQNFVQGFGREIQGIVEQAMNEERPVASVRRGGHASEENSNPTNVKFSARTVERAEKYAKEMGITRDEYLKLLAHEKIRYDKNNNTKWSNDDEE